MAYYVPSTPPMRGRAYSFSQPQYYPSTPYSGINTLPVPGQYYDPGMGVARSAPYYITPTVRSRSHSRPRHGRSHHRSHHGHHSGHSRRSHSVGAHRSHHHRPSTQYNTARHHTNATSARYHNSPSLGARILGFFGIGSSQRHADQYGRPIDSRGRQKYKY